MRQPTGNRSRILVSAYLDARDQVIAAGFAPEIDWQDDQRLEHLDESAFLRESAWVVLSAGLSERVVRGVFPGVSIAFLQWESAASIVREGLRCIQLAATHFNHQRKLRGVVAIAQHVVQNGFSTVRKRLEEDGVEYLRGLDYIGPVTSYHLAKNLGLDVVKPDRHLVRMAKSAGQRDPTALCAVISEATGDRLATVDLVLWRFAALYGCPADWPRCASRKTPKVRHGRAMRSAAVPDSRLAPVDRGKGSCFATCSW